MDLVRKSAVLMFLHAFFYSATGLLFVQSRFGASQFLFWVGIFGACFGITILALGRQKNRIATFFNTRQFYFSIVNAVIGGFAQMLIYCSLLFILPSESIAVSALFAVWSSVFTDVCQNRECPPLLSLLSVVLGLSGTLLICNPKELLSLNFGNMERLLGVCLAALYGLSSTLMYVVVHKLDKVSPEFMFLCYEVGICMAGFIHYKPYLPSISHCAIDAKLIGLLSICSCVLGSITLITGTIGITVTATYLIELLSSVITFVVQIFMFPDRFSWFSAVGTIFIVVAVPMQLRVLSRRNRQLLQSADTTGKSAEQDLVAINETIN